jgi:hypothetical protein
MPPRCPGSASGRASPGSAGPRLRDGGPRLRPEGDMEQARRGPGLARAAASRSPRMTTGNSSSAAWRCRRPVSERPRSACRTHERFSARTTSSHGIFRSLQRCAMAYPRGRGGINSRSSKEELIEFVQTPDRAYVARAAEAGGAERAQETDRSAARQQTSPCGVAVGRRDGGLPDRAKPDHERDQPRHRTQPVCLLPRRWAGHNGRMDKAARSQIDGIHQSTAARSADFTG